MFWALVKKEIRLQRSNILFAFAVILVWCLDFLLVFTGDRPLGSKILTTGGLVQIVHYFFVLPCLIVIFPMMVGAASVAQERKLGTLEWQATLPASQRMKWIAKTGAAVFLAFFLGGFLADILDGIIVLKLRGENISPVFGNELPVALRLRSLHIAIFSIVFCSSGIYVSSLSPEPFRALILGAVPVLFIGFIQRIVDPSMMLFPHWDSEIFPSGYVFPSIHYLEFTLFSLLLLYLGLYNFASFDFKWKRVGFHAFLLLMFINLIGYFTLRLEFDIPPIEEGNKTYTSGFTKLLDTQIPIDVTRNHFYYMDRYWAQPFFYRIPESSSILISKWGKKDIKRNDYSSRGNRGKIMKINIDTGRVHQYAGIYGIIEDIHPTGSFFIINPYWNKRSLILFDNGIYFPYLPRVSKYIRGGIFNLKMDDRDSLSYGTYKIGDGLYELKTVNREGEIISIFFQNPMSFYHFFISSQYDKNFFYNPYNHLLIKSMSPDGKWYADSIMGISPDEMKDFPDFSTMYPTLFNPIRIISADHTTTHVLETKGTVTLLRNPLNNLTMYDLYDWENLCRKHLALCISPDGRYLAFQRMFSGTIEHQGKTFPDFFPREIRICILDLLTGKESELKNVSWDPSVFQTDREYQSKSYEGFLESLQFPERTVRLSNLIINDIYGNLKLLPLFWLKENILAVLDGGKIHLFSISPEAKYLWETIDLEKDILLYENDPYALNMSSWSEDIILLWGEKNLWKLNLREYFKQTGSSDNPWFGEGGDQN